MFQYILIWNLTRVLVVFVSINGIRSRISFIDETHYKTFFQEQESNTYNAKNAFAVMDITRDLNDLH